MPPFDLCIFHKLRTVPYRCTVNDRQYPFDRSACALSGRFPFRTAHTEGDDQAREADEQENRGTSVRQDQATCHRETKDPPPPQTIRDKGSRAENRPTLPPKATPPAGGV